MDPFTREESNIVEGDKPWLLRNLVPMCAVALVVAAVIIGVLAWNLRQTARELDARRALVEANSPAKKMEVAREYLGTEEAALALMEAASTQYDMRDYAASVTSYDLFLTSYPEHPLRSGAFLGRGLALLANSEADKGIQSLQEAAQASSTSVYRPVAMFELAQAYAQAGKSDLQLEVLTKLSEEYATSLYGRRAIEKLAELNATASKEAATSSES